MAHCCIAAKQIQPTGKLHDVIVNTADLNIESLQGICLSIAEKIPCQISVMGEGGVVIASSIAGRAGKVHAGAAKIMSGEIDSYDVTREMASSSDFILEGCNLPIEVNGKRMASIGVAAPLDKAREFAAIAQSCIETLFENLIHQQRLMESEQRFRDYSESAADWFWEMDENLCFSSFTGRLEEVMGLKASDVIGMTREELYSNQTDTQTEEWQAHLQAINSYQPFADFEIPWQRPDGRHRTIRLSGKPLFTGDGQFAGYRGVGCDVSEYRTLELHQNFQNNILKMVAQGQSLDRILMTLIKMSEELSPGMLGSVLLLTPDGEHLVSGAAPSLPSFYMKAIDHMKIGPEVGSCGAAAFSGQTVIVSDISTHPYWAKARGIAEKADLWACWSQPILSAKKTVLGTFAMYYRETREPGEAELKLIHDIADLAGIAIDRNQAEEELTLHRDHLQGLVKQHTIKLTESEERFRTIAEGMSDWIWEMDSELRFSYFSDRFGDIIGSNPNQIIGKTREEIIDKNLPKSQFEGHLDDLRSHRVISNFVYPYRRQDGTLLYFKINGNPIHDREGTFTGYRGTASDVTKETMAEQALDYSNNRFKDIAEIASDWFWETDTNHRFTFISERFFSATEMDRKDVMGKSRLEIAQQNRWNDDSERWQTYTRNLNAKRPITLQYWVNSPSGKKTCIEVKGRPYYGEGGEFLGYRGAGTDITSIVKTTEDLMAATRAAEHANRAKSEFLSSMSHELRTPLNAILGFAQLLEAGKKEPLSDRQLGQVHRIIKGGEHLLSLVNEVLELAKIEAGKLIFSLESVKPKRLINDCLALAVTLAEKRSIAITDRTSNAMPNLWTDHLRAKQVLLNIISNAVKYNTEGGDIWMDAEVLNKYTFRIKVSDNGPGIPLEKQADIFQPFNRLGAESSEVEGTGIGLTLAKKLMTEMGGAINFESAPGMGSCFWIDFPIAQQQTIATLQDQDVELEPIINLPAQEHLLLYVEDNPANLALMEEIVEDVSNLDMISAVAAEQGLTLAEEYKPDIIVLDINLPGMSGLDAVKKLKRAENTKDIPVVALSANAMPSDIKRGLESGFERYLTKPINVAEFLQAVDDILGDTQ